MGKGAYMLMVNNDINNHNINIHNRHDMHDNGKEGSNVSLWDNQTLTPLQALPANGMQYIEAKDGSASFEVTIDGRTTVKIKIHSDKYSYEVNNNDVDIQICVNNIGTNRGFTKTDQAFISIVMNNTASNKNWMHRLNQDTNGLFFQKKLSEVCLPGAHDAGISILREQTKFSNKCNTQTQKHSIEGQLSRGTRYFDLRPAIWSKGDNTIYMGHFSDHTGVGLSGSVAQTLTSAGQQGAIGEYLVDVLDAVADFMRTDSTQNEIVLLKFSHFVSQDSSGFTKSLLNSLLTQIQNKLGSFMYTNTSRSVNLGSVSLQDIINSGKRVICLFSNADPEKEGNHFSNSYFNSIIDPTNGIFSFGDDDSSANYRLYDSYANNMDYDDMISNQLKKWRNFDKQQQSRLSRQEDSMFLYSYTLTSTDAGIIADNARNADGDNIRSCILDMAQSANHVLLSNLAYSKKKYNIETLPNILYIDKISRQYPINSVLYINKLFL